MQYLLRFWEMVYECQVDESLIPIIQFGILLEQFGKVVYL
jgi:hypothetical protein